MYFKVLLGFGEGEEDDEGVDEDQEGSEDEESEEEGQEQPKKVGIFLLFSFFC